MVEVECPVESGCDYSGPVKSVEAHISGSQSGAHRGEVGWDHREELVAAAEGRDPSGDTYLPNLPASPDGTGGDDRSDEVGGEGGADPSSAEDAGADDPDADLAGGGVESPDGTGDSDPGENVGEGGNSEPTSTDIPPVVGLVGATAIFSLWALSEGGLFGGGGEDADVAEQDSQQSQQQPGGGLVADATEYA